MKSRLLVLTLGLVLLSGCVVMRGVGRGMRVAGSAVASEFRLPYATPCNVTPAQFQCYACAHYGMCSGRAFAWYEAGSDPEGTATITEVVEGHVRDCALDLVAMKVEFCPRPKK